MIFIQDSREKLPFNFVSFGYEQIITKLQAGDYSLKGFETKLAIERKKNLGELYTNLVKKYKIFVKELKLLSKYELAQIIIECPMSDLFSFPVNSGIIKSKWPSLKANQKYLMKQVERVTAEFNIPVVFCNSRIEAQLHVINLFQNYVRQTT